MKLDFSGYDGEMYNEPFVPEHTRESLQRYVEHKILPGGFLMAVLTNDLFSAVGRADSENIKYLKDICMFVYNRMPANSWGNEDKVYKFVEEKFYETLDNWIEP
jgi:hypothetical protein